MISSRERVAKVFRGEIPDMVPFFPTIFTDHACYASGLRFEDAIINPALGTECMLKAALRYRTDAVRFTMGPGTEWYQRKIVRETDGVLVQYDRDSGQAEGFFDTKGGGGLILHEPPQPVNSVAEAESISVKKAKEYVDGGYLDDVRQFVGKTHDHGLFAVGMVGGQTINFMVEKLGGAEKALLCFFDDPDLARVLIGKAVLISLEKVRAFIGIGVDCIYIGDSYASGSVISPAIYEEFCAPAYRRVAAEAHRGGIFCYKHCCGNYNPFLDKMHLSGIDAMDGLDPTSGMSVKHTKEVVGSQLSLMGGLSCLSLLQGTELEVYEEARKCIEDGKPGGRYLLGSGCAVPRFTPPENMLAARKVIDDFGAY